MDEYGGYDGWTEHEMKVTPEWDGVAIDISGEDRNDTIDYLHGVYQEWLNENCEHKARED